jgi:hypothetical protein
VSDELHPKITLLLNRRLEDTRTCLDVSRNEEFPAFMRIWSIMCFTNILKLYGSLALNQNLNHDSCFFFYYVEIMDKGFTAHSLS